MDIKFSKLLLSKYNSLNDIRVQFMNTKKKTLSSFIRYLFA